MRLLVAGAAALLLAAAYRRRTRGPGSFRAQFQAEAAAGLARLTDAAPALSEADLAPLPEPVRRYLRAVGAVGQPRVRAYRVRFRGRIRSAPGARWMPFVADQQSFTDPPVRLFWMRARRGRASRPSGGTGRSARSGSPAAVRRAGRCRRWSSRMVSSRCSRSPAAERRRGAGLGPRERPGGWVRRTPHSRERAGAPFGRLRRPAGVARRGRARAWIVRRS